MDLKHAVKSYDMGPPALVPNRRKEFHEFVSPLNPLLRPGLNPRHLGPMVNTLTTTPQRQLQLNISTYMLNVRLQSVHWTQMAHNSVQWRILLK
jgi:hypothetical protein